MAELSIESLLKIIEPHSILHPTLQKLPRGCFCVIFNARVPDVPKLLNVLQDYDIQFQITKTECCMHICTEVALHDVYGDPLEDSEYSKKVALGGEEISPELSETTLSVLKYNLRHVRDQTVVNNVKKLVALLPSNSKWTIQVNINDILVRVNEGSMCDLRILKCSEIAKCISLSNTHSMVFSIPTARQMAKHKHKSKRYSPY